MAWQIGWGQLASQNHARDFRLSAVPVYCLAAAILPLVFGGNT